MHTLQPGGRFPTSLWKSRTQIQQGQIWSGLKSPWSYALAILTGQMRIVAHKTRLDAHVFSILPLANFEVSHVWSTYVTVFSTEVPGLQKRHLPRDLGVINTFCKLPNTSSYINFPLLFFTRNQRTS